MSRIDGKVALISGAASGIGAETARVLAEAGGVVVLADIDEAGGARVTAALKAAGHGAHFQRLDVTREQDWKSVTRHVCDELGGIDVVVNNAGIELIKRIADLTLDDWHRVSRVNLDGVFLGTKYGIWAMTEGSTRRPKGGSIVNLSSVAGLVGTPGQSAYNMSKGGVRLFTKSAALECAQLGYGIRVNSVHPGVIETPMVAAAWKEWSAVGFGATDAETRANVLALHPIGRLGRAEDVALAILYLASDDSSFVTGAELVVDGGLTAQ
jgi:NAD(P)-dependent dehydrogenase (short-subunit alcohol dehydrogenase family)